MEQELQNQTVKYIPDCQPATMDQVMEVLERWRKRSEDHFSNNRRDHRFPYPNRALVVCHERLGGEGDASLTPIVLEVHTRNLSCGGVSLLAPPTYVPERAEGNTPVLYTERLLAPGRELSIGLPRPGNEFLWMRGSIVRSRIVHFGFRECGVSFVSRHAE